MKISTTKLADVGRCVIKDGDGEKTDAVLLIAGPGHPATIAAEKRAWRETASEFNRKGKITLGSNADEVFDEQTERLVARTLGWENFQDEDGAQMPFSADAVRKLYADRTLSLRAQASEFMRELGNFTTGASAP